jgi:hypothetical protein
MSSTPHETDSDSAVAHGSDAVGWTAWPAAERPLRTVILLIFIAALSVLAGMIGGDVLWAATGAALLLATLNRWFLPTSYRFDDDDFEAGFPLRRRSIRWKDVRRVVIDPDGGWLSARRVESRLRAGAGLDLYWGREPEQAMDMLMSVAVAKRDAGVPIEIADRRAGSKGAA